MNKIYYFYINECEGGLFIAAKDWKEARKFAMEDELISESMEEFIDVKGHLVNGRKSIIFTDELEGILTMQPIIDLKLTWWSCEDCGSKKIEYFDEVDYKCNECKRINEIPFANM